MNKTEDSPKQQLILDVAEKLFAAKGFKGTSVRDIAQEAGVNISMISYYFGSKEGLLESVFGKRMAAGRVVLQDLLDNTSLSPIEKMDELIERNVDRMMDNRCFQRITLWVQLDEGDNNVRQMLIDQKKQSRQLLHRLILQGQEQNAFSKNIDTDMLITTLMGTIYQAVSNMQIYRSMFQEEGQSEEDYMQSMRARLKTHLKQLFKAILTHDVK